MKKLQYFALRSFLSMMTLCAGIMLSLVWRGGPDGPFGVWKQLAISAFIIGLASFLVWFVTIVLEIRDNLKK